MLLQYQALFLECDFSYIILWPETPKDDVYSCTGTVRYIGDSRIITQVTGTHSIDKNDSHVIGLLINGPTLRLAPRKIHQFFPNLESLALLNNNMEEISRDDLLGLTKLRVVNFYSNKIQRIDSNLFENHLGIEAFSIAENPVKHVGLSAFEHTTQLTTLHFYFNTCYSDK